MKIVEFRIFVPLSVEQCNTSCAYVCYKRGKEASGESASEGMEFVEGKELEKEGEKGFFTHKIMHLKSKVPAVIRWVIPDKYLHIHERSFDSFPHYLTEYEMPGMGENFVLSTDTKHYEYKSGDKIVENSAKLPENELEIRDIRYLDILKGHISDKNLKLDGFSYPELNINELVSNKKANIKEVPGWVENYKGPMTCIIKTVRFHFKWTGIQTAVEAFVLNSVFPDVFIDNHRAMVKWAPEWNKLTLEDIKKLEEEKLENDKQKQYN